jgi:serine/threonine protein kinase
LPLYLHFLVSWLFFADTSVRQLASSASGTVHLVKEIETGQLYAAKRIWMQPTSTSNHPPPSPPTLVAALKVLTSVRSPHVVGAHEFFADGDDTTIVMDICEGGDLASYQQVQVARGAFFGEQACVFPASTSL